VGEIVRGATPNRPTIVILTGSIRWIPDGVGEREQIQTSAHTTADEKNTRFCATGKTEGRHDKGK
jgi:hypothetical protein